MQGLIRLFWELLIMSLMKFLIRTGLIICHIQPAEQNLRDLVSHLALSTVILSVQIQGSYRRHSASSEGELMEPVVNTTLCSIKSRTSQLKKQFSLFFALGKREEKMYPSVKPSASVLFCLCLEDKRWGRGEAPLVHCCSWTQDISVLVLMQARDVFLSPMENTPQLVKEQRQ